MDAKKINTFYFELEKLATYNNEEISDEEFVENLGEIKNDLKNKEISIPEIFKLVRTKWDFRSNMQKYGGYQDRREKLKNDMYPIIEMYEQKIIEKKEYKEEISLKELNKYIKSNNNCLKTKYGNIEIPSLECKSGGNGSVYFGKMNKIEVAVKFLMNITTEKLNRFLCEYGNVIMKLNENDGVVKMFFYDELVINNKIYPIICMKKYENKLVYRDDYTEDEIIDIVKQILYSVKNIHDSEIIHRDLKPDNILMDDGKVYIADFGIAYFNPDFFEITGHTKEGERLANFDFSAPEQRNSKIKPTKSADIYAIGQIIQWLVFGVTTKGTHRKNLYKKINTPRMRFLDNIVDKALSDDLKERYQSVDEILNEIEEYNFNKKELKKIELSIEGDVIEKKFDFGEIKEALKDVMDKICFASSGENESGEKNFYLYSEMNRGNVVEFLDKIPENLRKLEFFDDAVFSKFVNGIIVVDRIAIEKEKFVLLKEIYDNIKENFSDLEDSCIEYIKTKINENFVLPF